MPIRDDIILEDDEVFQVILSTDHINATVAGIAIANVTIEDNDLGQFKVCGHQRMNLSVI